MLVPGGYVFRVSNTNGALFALSYVGKVDDGGVANLLFLGFAQSSNSRSDWSSGSGGVNPGSSSYDSLTPLAWPNTNARTLHWVLKRDLTFKKLLLLVLGQIIYLSTESASVLRVLGDFNLLDHLTQGGTITSTILASDSNLLCTLCLKITHKFVNIVTHQHNLETIGGYVCNKIRGMHSSMSNEQRKTDCGENFPHKSDLISLQIPKMVTIFWN